MKPVFKAAAAFLAASFLFGCSLTTESNDEYGLETSQRAVDYSFNRVPSGLPPLGVDGSVVNPTLAPQFVIFGYDDNQFDDGMHSILDMYKTLNNPAGAGNPLTYDGTPAKASFYVNPGGRDAQWDWTVDDLAIASWKRAYDEGHEIGNHTWYHEHGLAFTVERWSEEIRRCNDFLVERVGIPREAITGFRTPFLEYNDNLFYALKEQGIEYDSSYEGGLRWDGADGSTNIWPYTMDNGAPFGENGKPLPRIPGLWEMPVDAVYVRGTTTRVAGIDYSLWFSRSSTKAEFLDILKNSLELKYNGNRAPMNFTLHTNYYSDKYVEYAKQWTPGDIDHLKTTVAERTAAVKEFLQWALTLQDVRVVTAQQALEWIKYPVKLGVAPAVHTVELTASPHGTVTPAPGVHQVNDYRDFKLTIDADPGYLIDSVTVDGVPQVPGGNKLETLILSGITTNRQIDVQFAKDINAVVYTINATSGAEGSFDKEGITLAEAGESVVYDVTIRDNCIVKTFTVNGMVISNPVFPYVLENISSDMTLTLEFEYLGAPFHFSYYWIYDYRDGNNLDMHTPLVDLLDIKGQVIESVPEALARRLAMEGSGFTPEGRLVSLANSFDWPGSRFFEVEQSIAPWGYDLQGSPLKKWYSAAVDTTSIPLNSDIYVKAFDGLKLSDNTIHNGWMKATQNSISCCSDWIDMFSATYQSYSYLASMLNYIQTVTVKHYPGTVFNVTLESGAGGFLTSSLNGELTPETSVQVAQGMDRAFIAVPESGYRVESVTVNGVLVEPTIPAKNLYNLTNIQVNMVVQARFVRSQPDFYKITATAGANGTVTPSMDLVPAGMFVDFKATPDAGYVIDTALFNGEPVIPFDNTLRVRPVKDSVLSVTFKVNPLPEYTVSVSASTGGTVSPGFIKVREGDSVVIIITPEPGYQVDSVTVNGVVMLPVNNRIVIDSVMSDLVILVTFKKTVDLKFHYMLEQDWGTGFSTRVTISNEGVIPVHSWKVVMTFQGDQKISGWGAAFTQEGKVVTCTNLSWNGTIQPGASCSFGFNGTYTGLNDTPSLAVSE